MDLIVLSTAEESKTVKYRFNKSSVFTYRVVNLKDFDAREIMEAVESKIQNGMGIGSKEWSLLNISQKTGKSVKELEEILNS